MMLKILKGSGSWLIIETMTVIGPIIANVVSAPTIKPAS